MKNPISCSTICYAMNGFSLTRALEGISKAGYKYVELSAVAIEGGKFDQIQPEKKDASDLVELKKEIREYGLEVSSISGHSEIIGKTVEEDNWGIKQLVKRIDLAAYLRAEIVNTGTGEAVTTEEIDRFYSNIKVIVTYCVKKDVKVALEPHGEFTSNGIKLAQVVEKINSEYIGVNYDPANIIYYGGGRPEEDIKNVAESIIHFHVKDSSGGKGEILFPPIGEGNIDFNQLFNVLKKVNYQGPLSIEVEFEGPGSVKDPERVDAGIKKSLRYVKGLW